jgi:ligand-binding sensor domain-containing protein/signal transduction histidine kinase
VKGKFHKVIVLESGSTCAGSVRLANLMENVILNKKLLQCKQLWPLVLAGFVVGFACVPFQAAALDPNQSIFQYNCLSWSRHNGLPANNVYAIAQTKDGYLWLGTSIGLLRFDGVEFMLIGAPLASELRNTRITCLCPARNGGLWFGLEHSAYGFHDVKGGWVVGKNPRGDVDWNVSSLLETPDQTLWLGGEYCSKIAAGATNLQLLFPGQPQAPVVDAVLQDSRGRVWLGTLGQGLYYWQDGKVSKLSDTTLDGRLIHALAEDKLGRLWVGTQAGLLCYGSDLQNVRGRFPSEQIKCLLMDRHGVLWGGTTGNGIFRCKGTAFDSLRKADGLASDDVLTLAEDQEGGIWVGTQDGLSQLTDVKFPTYSAQYGIPSDNAVHSVSASPRGGLWVSTAIGAIYFNHGVARMYSTNAGLTIPYVKRTLEARNGDVFVLSGRNEIDVMSGDRVVASYATTNMPVALVEDSQGVVASVEGKLYRVSRDGLVPCQFTNGQAPGLYWVLNLAPGRDDSIWVACVNGICRVKDGSFKQWTQSDGLAENNARWVCEEPDGTVWVGLATGIARLRNGRFQNLRRQDGLLDPNICAIMPDEYGNLWVYTLRGLFRLNKKNVDDFFRGKVDHVECAAYEGPEGYGQEDSACRTKDGHFWFPGSKGVIMVDPTNIPINWVVPPVHVHRIRASGVELDRSKPLVLKPGQQEIEFSYTAISFISPDKIRFRYKLDGLDRDWIEAGERRLAYYANLSPGRYTFRVIACNADGVWNNAGDSIQIELLPHFYQTVWFRLLCGFAAVGAVFGGYSWRLRHLTRKQQALQETQALLEKRVKERTAELAESNTSLKNEIEERKRMEQEVERIHHELVAASRQAGQAEVASSVLHNVGNVLNSVNVSTSLIRDHLGRLSSSNLDQAAQMIQEHADDLGRFLTTDERGRHFPRYLSEVSQYLSNEQNYLLNEINGLAQNVEHINEIVSMQQNYANVSGVHEKVAVSEIVEGGITMNAGAFSRHGIKVEREYEPVDLMTVDKHKMLQILVNLLRNAKYACDEGGSSGKRVTVRIKRAGNDRVRVEIADNGVGIPPENLTRIFSHGFTTRKHGHGFGLHSSALAAREMGGTLTVQSAGAGQGATFILDLPLSPANPPESKSSKPGSR